MMGQGGKRWDTCQWAPKYRNVLGSEERAVLGREVEQRVLRVLEEATKLMYLRHQEELTAEHVNDALLVLQEEPLYSHSSSMGVVQSANGTVAAVDTDDTVSLMELLQQPVAACPMEPSLRWHWLSVNGVQPRIAANPNAPDETESILNAGAVHELSEEMRSYYAKVSVAVRGDLEPHQVKYVWDSLREDPGLQELVPYFIGLCRRKISSAGTACAVIGRCLELLGCLFQNGTIDMHWYLQQVVPALLTCIVRKTIGARGQDAGAAEEPADAHFAIRAQAAEMLTRFCKQFAHAYPTLLPRVWKMLVAAVEDEAKPPEALYGGIVGLASMGKQVTQSLLLPMVPTVLRRIDAQQGKAGAAPQDDAERRGTLLQCRSALLKAVGGFLQGGAEGRDEGADGAAQELTLPDGFSAERVALGELAEAFGEQILPYALHNIPLDRGAVRRRSQRFAS